MNKEFLMWKRFLGIMAAALCVLNLTVGSAFSADLVKVPTAWLDEHETFLMWYAKEKGWDKEAGLDIEMKLFNSGPDILNALPAGEWRFAAVGALPAMLGNLRYGTSIIAQANNEAALCTSVVVRADSPIAKVKGWNKDYPEVYGSPETVRGKTFLATTLTSSHYALSTWLHVLGLKDSDVVIKNMDQSQVVGAFENNIGDGIAIWAPHTFIVQEKGGVVFAGDIVHCQEVQPHRAHRRHQVCRSPSGRGREVPQRVHARRGSHEEYAAQAVRRGIPEVLSGIRGQGIQLQSGPARP